MMYSNSHAKTTDPDQASCLFDKTEQDNQSGPLTRLANEYSDVIEKIDRNKPVAIIAGHYCLADHMQELSSDGEAESMCFELGVQLFLRSLENGTRHHLIVWVNDIGISQEKREAIKNDFTLPDNYQRILKSYGLDSSDVTVMFEGSMRNKASTLVKKILKQQPGRLEKVDANNSNLVRCIQSTACEIETQGKNHAYVIEGPNKERLVIKEGPAPKCNLILATFFTEITSKFSPQHFVNIFNDVYAYRLRLGVHVANKLLNNTVAMTNVLCDGEQIKCEFFDHSHLEESLI